MGVGWGQPLPSEDLKGPQSSLLASDLLQWVPSPSFPQDVGSPLGGKCPTGEQGIQSSHSPCGVDTRKQRAKGKDLEFSAPENQQNLPGHIPLALPLVL